MIPAVPMIEAVGAEQGDLVGDVPHGQSIGLADELDAIHDPLAGEHILVVEAKLFGEEGRREIVVGLADQLVRFRARDTLPAIHGVVDEKGPVDPAIAALAILDPDQGVVQAVEKRRQLQAAPGAVS